jgi:hypothetical protein
MEVTMNRKPVALAIVAALALGGSVAVRAQERVYPADHDFTYRLGRAADWNVNAAEGMCRLRVWVDDRAHISLRGDQIIVNTDSGKRSFDQGSVCTQPLPFHSVDDFHITVAQGRGAVADVHEPARSNNYTGEVTVVDPDNGGDSYELVMAWRNPGTAVTTAPLALNDPFPQFDETRACQDRVRGEFVRRNRDDDGYVEFTAVPSREVYGTDRERIHGEAWARSRAESRPIHYECVVNDRTNRVVSASYEVRGRARLSSLQ